ncbi:MAG: SGNH/GDSL hydrolase family protein [Planctomycetota bacterium JB042]
MKRLFLRLLLVTVVAAAILAACEAGVRLFFREGLSPEFLQPEAGRAYFGARMLRPVEEDGVRYAGREGASVTIRGVEYAHDDALGLRVAPEAIEKPEGTFRIVVVGDSNAYGWGVPAEATFARQVEAALRAAGRTADVAVLGFPGYNTGDQAALLRRLGPRLRPDLVLVAWFANDLERLGFHVDSGGWLFADPLPLPDAWKPTLWRSFLYRRISVNEVSRMRDAGEYVLGEGPNLEFGEEKLLELSEVARGLGARLAVVHVPPLEVVGAPPSTEEGAKDEPGEEGAAPATASGGGVDPRTLTLHPETVAGARSGRWLKKVCGLYGFPHLDLLDAVIGVPAPLLWASPEHRDHHPNADAHRRFAEAIVPWLEEKGFLP